jgi:hypothetical protein
MDSPAQVVRAWPRLDSRRIFAAGFKSYAVLPCFRANFFAKPS